MTTETIDRVADRVDYRSERRAHSVVPTLDLRQMGDEAEVASLPHNIDAEQALLGAVLFDNGAYDRIEGFRAEHFFEPFHSRLYAAMEAAVGRGQLAEPIALAQKFSQDPAFCELGGLRYLADLVDRAPPAAYAPDFARVVTELARRRAIIEIGEEAAHDARQEDPDKGATALIERVELRLFDLAEKGRTNSGFQPFSAALAGAVEMAAEAFNRDGGLSGLSTGLADLDQQLGGLHPSDLIILAARPSMGKTALATNIAFNVAKSYAWEPRPDGTRKTVAGGVVGFYSLEMSAEQLAMRLLADVSGVPSDRIRKGDIDASEFGRVRDAAMDINASPLFIDASGAITIAQIAARARRLKRTSGLDLIVVDYLQLASGSREARQGGRVQEVSEITVGLKAMAKELGVPVLALAQLSRQVESREDKRPQLSDLRESGSIEQDADVVMFIYREAYYKSRTEPREGTPEHIAWVDDMDRCRHVAEIIVGKQRHGPIGTVRTHFNDELTRFSNLAREGRFGEALGRNPYGSN